MTDPHALSSRQLLALALISLTAPAVTVCAALPWWWVLFATVVIALLSLLLLRVFRSSSARSLTASLLRLRTPGKLLLLGTAAFVLLAMRRLCELSPSAFPDTPPTLFVPLTMLAVCAWACASSRAAVLRAVGVSSFFVFAAYALIAVYAIPCIRLDYVFRASENDGFLLATLLQPLLCAYLVRREDPVFLRPSSLLMFAVVPTAAGLLTASVPGAAGSFYRMAKSVQVVSAAGRIEPIVSAALTVGWFTSFCLHALTIGEIIAALGGSRRLGSVFACAFAATGAVAEIPIPSYIYAAGATVFCVLVPLFTLCLEARKKPRKTLKKGEKRG